MGYAGRIEDKLYAQSLRRQGFSYREILNVIPASKDTISRWCRDIKLSDEQLQKLYAKKRAGGLRGCIIGAKKQQEIKLKKIDALLTTGLSEVGTLSKRDRFIIGIAFYLAEGTKGDGKCAVTNTDPRLIKFMMNWFIEFCEIPLTKFRGAIWLHDNLDEIKAKEYWSNLTGIPVSQFHKTYIAKNKLQSKKIRKNIHNYGVFSLRFTDVNVHRKLMGWIAGLVGRSMV